MADVDLVKPMPVPTPVTRPFWDALREHRVRIQRCDECDAWVFYPRAACPRCWSTRLAWHAIEGTGELYTYTVARVPTAPHFRDEVPQIIAVVELDEGPRLTSTLVDLDPEEVEVGMRLRPVFDDVADRGVTLLRYTRA